MSDKAAALVCGTLLLIAILAGVFALAWHGTLTGTQALQVVMVIVALAGGVLGVHVGISAAQQPPPPAPPAS